MRFLQWLRKILIGRELNPFDKQIFRHIALVAFFAWIGLGADGLSSSCYGPEEAYLALGKYQHLILYIAIATAITVFILGLSYNQVIELFPNGGGGYKVATQLLHPYAGLVSGAALIVDYTLTITISIASGSDAIFSLVPNAIHHVQLSADIIIVLLLLLLNIRGMKESIKFLLPIFLGFVITHVAIIFYGLFSHRQGIFPVMSQAVSDTVQLKQSIGWTPLLFLLLHSYSVGAGTYTGLEAVSNNVHRLAEPRVHTGKWAMGYIAISLSITAGGLMLLYLLWKVQPVVGETLNATVFRLILKDNTLGGVSLSVLLLLEAGLLLVAANTGFIAGPATLGNMAMDDWVPSRFRHLSYRLVMQNSLIFYGVGAIALLLWTRGSTHLLVVLYSINVFITFSLSLLGLCVYWWQHRKVDKRWKTRFPFSIFAFTISISILMVMVSSKFLQGGWLTLIITLSVIMICLFIKRHYLLISEKLKVIDAKLTLEIRKTTQPILPPDPKKPTAVFFIAKNPGIAMHTLLNALRLFPGHFKNFIFISAGVVDVQSFQGIETLEKMRSEVESNLDYLVNYCQQFGYSSEKYAIFDTEVIDPLLECAKTISELYRDCTFFASKLILERETWFTRLLDNETSLILQKKIFALGKQLIILPIKI